MVFKLIETRWLSRPKKWLRDRQPITKQLHSISLKIPSQRDAELLKAMFKIYPENYATPFWVKTAITRVTDDMAFSTAAEEFFESNDDIDPIDFAEFMYFPKLNAAERKKSMHLAAIIAQNDSKKETSLDTNVNTRVWFL